MSDLLGIRDRRMPVRSRKADLLMIPPLVLVLCSQVWAAAKPTTRTEACVAEGCHDIYQKMEHVHPPVTMGVCKFCHRAVDPARHTFKLLREGGQLCSYCHWDRDLEGTGHQSLGNRECTGCHNPHATGHEFLLPAPTVAKVCQQCHEKLLEGKRSLHNPVAAGECTACHDPHKSDHGKLLKADPEQLCFICHEATRSELEKFEHVHEPVKEKGCGACHDAHGSDHAMNLKEDVPALCYSCHQEVNDVAQHAEHRHSVVGQKGGCLKCHTPHASTAEFLLKNDPLTLCLSCHDKEITTEEGKVIANVKSQIEGKKYLHGPVAQKDCNACHLSHGSAHFRLLLQEYPSEFYAPFERQTYALCFGCHPEKSVLTRGTTDLTDFRNGSLNLHYVHVNKRDRGRTCRACHATHGSNQPKHIRESVPFGLWEIPLKFEKTETGGHCTTGCHGPLAYDREFPADYTKLAPQGPASQPGEPKGSSQPQTDFPQKPNNRGETGNDTK